jgi:hypothetical protein
MTSATRLNGEPGGCGEFAVPSASCPGACHTVIWRCADVHWCDCPAHQRRRTCRHVQAVALAVEVEAHRPATPERRAFAARRLAEIAKEMAS